jgi:hypothetical protein
MKWKFTKAQTRLYIVAASILLIGLGSATLIYLTAENASDSTLVHDFENSKRYRHDLEVIGGKMNVVMDQFFRWFGGLWCGRSLAFTVAWISIFLSLGFFIFAYRWPSDPVSHVRGENTRGDYNP